MNKNVYLRLANSPFSNSEGVFQYLSDKYDGEGEFTVALYHLINVETGKKLVPGWIYSSEDVKPTVLLAFQDETAPQVSDNIKVSCKTINFGEYLFVDKKLYQVVNDGDGVICIAEVCIFLNSDLAIMVAKERGFVEPKVEMVRLFDNSCKSFICYAWKVMEDDRVEYIHVFADDIEIFDLSKIEYLSSRVLYAGEVLLRNRLVFAVRKYKNKTALQNLTLVISHAV